MSTLGWIALVLAALAIALVLWAVRGRSRRSEAGSPRTVADLVRLRAEQAEPEPDVVEPALPPVEAEAEAPLVEAVPEPAPVPRAARVMVPASADDTPWNRAARIAETDGVVWATDDEWPGWADWADDEPAAANPARPEPVLRPVQLPALPPDLVDTRSTIPAADPTAQAGAAADLPAEDGPALPLVTAKPPGADGPAAGRIDAQSVVAEPGSDEPGSAGAGAAEQVPVEQVVVEPDVVEPDVVEVGAVESEAAGPAAAEPDPIEHTAGPLMASASGAAPLETAPVETIATRAASPSGPEPVRARRTPAETAAEQAAADLALLRTFGCALPDDEPSTVSLEGAVAPAVPHSVDGAAQPVAFRVVGRDGEGVPGASVTLLDDRGRDAAGAVADGGGRGSVLAPRPGSYVLVSAAAGHQPGAVAITVAAEPVAADLLLARSASLAGTVCGEDGPVVGARLTLVQDGDIVDGAQSGPGGEYHFVDLAAGEYGLSVTAAECEPAALLVTVPDETDLRLDVDLDPEGLVRPSGDMMIGHG
jgi:hypothetical protein